MNFNIQTVVTLALFLIGLAFVIPVLAKGFSRRGKGVVYQSDFLLQRAPQLISLLNIALIVLAFLTFNNTIGPLPQANALSLVQGQPGPLAAGVSWLGVVILLSGFIFMVGGWYSLGESFSTDAELLHGQKLRDSGLLKFVMHPAYSGIIQSLAGASIAALSPLCLGITVLVIAPLWLKRAKYEEELLIKTFGDEYKDYAQKVKWRRLVPCFIPIGV